MNFKRVSRATTYHSEEISLLQTQEDGLLSSRDGEDIMKWTPLSHSMNVAVIGAENIDTYAAQSAGVWLGGDADPNKLGSTILNVETSWRSNLLTHELAARTIEAIISKGETVSNEKNHHLREARIKSGSEFEWSNKPVDVDAIERYTKAAEVLGEKATQMLSLADWLSKERVAHERTVMVGITSYSKEVLGADTFYGARIPRKYSGAINEIVHTTTGFQQTEAIFATAVMALKMFQDEVADEFKETTGGILELARGIIHGRGHPWSYQLEQAGTQYDYFPSNTDMYAGFELIERNVKRKHFRPLSISDEERKAASQRIAEAEAARTVERQRVEKLKLEQSLQDAEHDAPILHELERIASEYNAIVTEITGQSNKSLREKGLLGKDSLHYALMQSDKIDRSSLDRTVRVYDYIYELSQYGEEAVEMFAKEMIRLEELRAEFIQFKQSHPLRGNGVPTLEFLINSEVSWLGKEWILLDGSIKSSKHQKFYTPDRRAIIATMLGVTLDEKTHKSNEDSSNVIHDIPNESPLTRANKIAERLNWIVLPDEPMEADELTDLAEKAVRSRQGGERRPAVVESYRMEGLLQLRAEFGGELFRSDERMLGDNENLYFALRFTHLGDENNYVIAENPVYGNATYILREDILPLMSGETALAALKLYRRDVRELGAKSVRHGKPDIVEHIEKIKTAIEDLSES